MANNRRQVLIVAPSLDVERNVSGVSAVTNFIIAHNTECEYTHFLQGRSDGERGALRRIARLLTNYRGWVQTLKTMGADVLIHYNFPLDAPAVLRDYFFMRAAHRMGRKMVVHLHGGLYLFKEEKPFIIRRFMGEIFSWDLPFIAQSEKEKRHIQQHYHTLEVTALPNCVDLTAAATYTKEMAAGRMDILFLGRIEKNKGMDFLYEAMVSLQASDCDFCLHFAGVEQGGEGYVERFQSLLGHRFVYEGVVSGDAKYRLFRQCQVFLLPSLYEGLPMSLIECMSFGLVPVVTDVGSIGEYVTDGENGLMVGVGDAPAIVEALQRLYADMPLAERLSASARHTVFDRLRPETYISRLNQIYHTFFE